MMASRNSKDSEITEKKDDSDSDAKVEESKKKTDDAQVEEPKKKTDDGAKEKTDQGVVRKYLPTLFYISPLDSSHMAVVVGYLIVIFAAIGTRLYKLNEPDHVCWDETHFGKHASYYLNGSFFFDVHPPLGKLLIAAAGYVSGYNGTFAFDKPGDKYEDHSYYGMRLLCAIFGILIVPIAYMTVHELTNSCTAAVISSSFLICDTGLLSLTQYILLDPPLICFIAASVMTAFKFMDCRDIPFSLEWWWWLFICGCTLSFSIGVKFVGLFVILFVGMVTIKDLWDILGDLRNSLFDIFKHFMARAICLIFVPFVMYCAIFFVHFSVLYHSGNGDGFMSSGFQSTLVGNDLYERHVPEDVAYGSIITLKSHRPGGALLHSHHHLYPEEAGPVQQQITAYSHKDDNNNWLVKKPDQEVSEDDEVEILRNGDIVRLEHVSTRRNLHSHNEKAPLTKDHLQASGYGKDGIGDANDFWRVEIVGGGERDPVKTVSTIMRLRHANVGCYLYTHSEQLPKWGWEQHEVTCCPHPYDPNTLWNVEGHVNPKLPNVSGSFYKPSFFQKLYESHFVMTVSNSNLKPKEGEVTSRPWQWPLNTKGQVYSGGDYRVYMLGNPVVFWLTDAMIVVYLVILLLKLLLDKRQIKWNLSVKICLERYLYAGTWLFLAWALHYLPFFMMGRVLYFHHYFPAYIFQCMLAGVTVEFCIGMMTAVCSWSLQPILYHSAVVAVLGGTVYSFILFMPLSYGMDGPRADEEGSSMYGLRWLSTWEF